MYITSLKVSVIIPTLNRPKALKIILESLLGQTVLPNEVIIVDQSKTDETKVVVNDIFYEHNQKGIKDISLIVFGLIIVTQSFVYGGLFTLEAIFVNYGIKFLIQALISIIFIVPLLLFLYDRVLAKEEKHIYQMILTHHPLSASDHTFYLKFGRTKIYFCSRCSGVIVGGLIALFTTYLIFKIYNVEFSAEIALLLCIILPIPGLLDWGTQRLLLRKSTTGSRLLTGFIIGLALHFMSFTYKYFFYTMLILVVYFTIFGLLVFFGHKKEMRLFKEEYDSLSYEEQTNFEE